MGERQIGQSLVVVSTIAVGCAMVEVGQVKSVGCLPWGVADVSNNKSFLYNN